MNAVQMTAKMYEARDAAKILLGDRYPAKMQEYGTAIQELAKLQGIDDIVSMTCMADAAMKDGNQYAACFAIAAYVEMVEPST